MPSSCFTHEYLNPNKAKWSLRLPLKNVRIFFLKMYVVLELSPLGGGKTPIQFVGFINEYLDTTKV